MKTVLIIGAGPGLGLSLAKKFGHNNFRVAAIARNSEKLNSIINELTELNIVAKAFVADITDLTALKKAIEEVKQTFGSIDVLEFSPYSGPDKFTHVLETTPESVMEQINGFLIPAIFSINEVLPEMINNGSGAILLTTGLSAMYPIPMIGNAGIVMSGIRNYATNLHNELKDKGIYVGILSIGTLIQHGTVGDPDHIADVWFNMYSNQDQFEEVFPLELDLTKF